MIGDWPTVVEGRVGTVVELLGEAYRVDLTLFYP
jgi:hypothetical protein